MARVRILKTMAGPGVNYAAGDVADFPDDVAAELVQAGAAVLIPGPKPPPPEAAAMETEEKATKPAPKRRRRSTKRTKKT